MINGTWQSVAGTYSEAYQDINQCDSTHIIQLNYYNPINVTENLTICEFDSVFVFNQWVYNTLSLIQIEQDVNGCDIVHTVNIQENSCIVEPPVIFIPNVFTPNGDQVNDTFEIVIQNGIVERGFILNRWGNVIANFSPNQLKWDGKDERSGLPVLDGVYTYVVYFNPGNTVNKLYHGFIVVVR
jgi:gliding motility-associated-like protein